ncbi:hypothetical protein RhiirC2_797296 [Rhizophagus irregularis]|uniref:Uncharacterized protein n=1 Tax=Rhizophagus irregularis TaxID=588596 RepID=A0A2N1M892_9GLOM|nr:hypothetical protein RhiirC2_797296 [Rhizophagus irregularis]
MLPTLTVLQQRKSYLYSLDWLYPQCNSAPEDLNHLWTCFYILPDLNPCSTHRSKVIKFRDSCLSSFLSLKTLNPLFNTGFSTLDCWDYKTPSPSCLWLTRGLLPAHLMTFLKQYFSFSVIYKTISPLLNDFQVELYGEIWLCRNVLFHAWEESQALAGFPNSIATYANGIIQDNPSSSRTEADIIYAVLTISLRDSEITIYTDLQTAIDGL